MAIEKIKILRDILELPAKHHYYTSHSAYVATATESDGVKIDGLLPPNFL